MCSAGSNHFGPQGQRALFLLLRGPFQPIHWLQGRVREPLWGHSASPELSRRVDPNAGEKGKEQGPPPSTARNRAKERETTGPHWPVTGDGRAGCGTYPYYPVGPRGNFPHGLPLARLHRLWVRNRTGQEQREGERESARPDLTTRPRLRSFPPLPTQQKSFFPPPVTPRESQSLLSLVSAATSCPSGHPVTRSFPNLLLLHLLPLPRKAFSLSIGPFHSFLSPLQFQPTGPATSTID